jgi:steroid 5-alpha reductase family enzyme
MDSASIGSQLIVALTVSLGINLSMFLIAFWRKSDKLTDISYAATFATIAMWSFIASNQTWYHALLLLIVLVWAARLGGFLLYRVIKKGKDARFDGMRESFTKFGKFWLGQALTVWVMMIPSVFAFNAEPSRDWLAITGVAVWAVGLVCETVADLQKMTFSNNPANKNKWIDTGIWHYSRHPNYFGEILVWVGVYLYTIASLPLLQGIISLVSPAFIIILLLFISGIPILEKSADERWGNDAKYRAYKKHTHILVPFLIRA